MLKYLFYFCVASLSLGQFSAIYKTGESNIYLFDLTVGLFVFVSYIYFLAVRKKLIISRKFFPFIAFTVIAVLSLIFNSIFFSSHEIFVAGFYLIRWLFYLLAALAVFNMYKQSILSLTDFLLAFIYSGVFISLVGFVQLAVLPDFSVLDPSLGWDPHINRLASTFFDPNFTGGYLVLCLSLVLWAINNNEVRINRKVLIYSSIILALAILLTFSRSTWLMLGIVVLVFGIYRYRLLLILSLLLVFLAYFAVPRVQTRISGITDPADSAHFRLISWENTWNIAKDNLILGTGFNTFRYVQKDYGYLDHDTFVDHAGAGSDSSILFVLATTGLLGLFLFLAGYLNSVFNSLFSSNGDRILGAILLGLLLHAQFINSLFYPQIMFMWLCLIGIFTQKLSRM
jgi:O-antigen ligase